MNTAEKALGAVFFETAGWERPFWYASNEALLGEYGDAVMPRAAEWDSRWWSPIINAEHLAMRERAGVVDLTAFADLRRRSGRAALDAVQRIVRAELDVKVGRVVYTPVLTPSGGFKADLTMMRLGARTTSGWSPAALTGNLDRKWFADAPAAGRWRHRRRPDLGVTTVGVWGPRARDILGSLTATTSRTRASGSAPAARIEAGRAGGARVADLLRRRARLGAVRADRVRRTAVGPVLRGRRTARRGAGRDRRVRHHRPVWRRATAPTGPSWTPSTPSSRPACSGPRSRTPTSSAGRRTSSSGRGSRRRCCAR